MSRLLEVQIKSVLTFTETHPEGGFIGKQQLVFLAGAAALQKEFLFNSDFR